MKEESIIARAKELAVLFADIPDDVLMRFVNRNRLVCSVFSRAAILRALADKPNVGREQLKSFLCKSVPEVLRRKPEDWHGSWSTKLKSRYEKHISCENTCIFDPPLPRSNPEYDIEFVENAQEVANRDRELLKKLQQNDEIIVQRELLNAELERYVKEEMAELRKENLAYLELLRQEMLQKCGVQETKSEEILKKRSETT